MEGELSFKRILLGRSELVRQLIELLRAEQSRRAVLSAGAAAFYNGFGVPLTLLPAAAALIPFFFKFLRFFLPAATGLRCPAFDRTAVDLAITTALPGDRMRKRCGPQDQRSHRTDRNCKVYSGKYPGNYFSMEFIHVISGSINRDILKVCMHIFPRKRT